MPIQYYRVYPSSHGAGIGLPPVLPAESSTKPARFERTGQALRLNPAALPRLPAFAPACPACLPPRCPSWPAACRIAAALPALPAVFMACRTCRAAHGLPVAAIACRAAHNDPQSAHKKALGHCMGEPMQPPRACRFYG
jgi:hypothetical protein